MNKTTSKLHQIVVRYKQPLSFLAFVIIAAIFFRRVDTELIITDAKRLLQSFGLIAPLISICLLTIDGVFPVLPISSLALLFSNSILFGFWGGFAISFSGVLLSALCCYAVGYKFRHRIRKAISSDATLRYMENLKSPMGLRFLIFCRLTIFMPFNVISFLCGIADLSFTKYVVITLCGIIPSLLSYSFFGYRLTHIGFSRSIAEFITLNMIISCIAYLCWIYSLPKNPSKSS